MRKYVYLTFIDRSTLYTSGIKYLAREPLLYSMWNLELKAPKSVYCVDAQPKETGVIKTNLLHASLS